MKVRAGLLEIDYTSYDSDSTNRTTSLLLPAWTDMFSQSVHSDVDTAQVCAGNTGQRRNLPLWGCYENTNECGIAKHAMDIACNTMCLWSENVGICCGQYGAPDTLKQVYDIYSTPRNLNQQMKMSLTASWRQATLDLVQNCIIPSGSVNKRHVGV